MSASAPPARSACGPHVERAFERPKVTVDFFGFTAETLHGAIQEPLDKIRAGAAAPESIAVRILLPDTTLPWRSRAAPTTSPMTRPSASARMQSLSATPQRSSTPSHELDELGLVSSGNAEVRVAQRSRRCSRSTSSTATGRSSASTPSPAAQVTLQAEPHDVYDLMGKDATLFHHATSDDPTSIGSQYVEQMHDLVRHDLGHSQPGRQL